jgi:hypothetical protein
LTFLLIDFIDSPTQFNAPGVKKKGGYLVETVNETEKRHPLLVKMSRIPNTYCASQ